MKTEFPHNLHNRYYAVVSIYIYVCGVFFFDAARQCPWSKSKTGLLTITMSDIEVQSAPQRCIFCLQQKFPKLYWLRKCPYFLFCTIRHGTVIYNNQIKHKKYSFPRSSKQTGYSPVGLPVWQAWQMCNQSNLWWDVQGWWSNSPWFPVRNRSFCVIIMQLKQKFKSKFNKYPAYNRYRLLNSS